MDEWRKDWRRIGSAMMATAFGLYVARLSASSQLVVTPRHGRPYVIGPPDPWLVWVFLALGLIGFWGFTSTYISWVPWLQKKAAQNPGCVLSVHTEYLSAGFDIRDREKFEGITYLFITVENKGGTASFAAQFSNVRGLHRRNDGLITDNYFGKVAWEDTVEDRQVLGTGSKAKLMAMELFAQPKACWFEVPYSAKWAIPGDEGRTQLAGWCLVRDDLRVDALPVGFDLTVVNEDKKAWKTWRVDVPWDWDGTVGEPSLVAL